MSVKVMGMVFDATDISSTQKLVMLALADYANEEGRSIYPSVETISKRTSLTERAVRKTLSDLRKRGVIVIVKRSGQHRANEYAIDVTTLKGMSRPAPDAPLKKSDLNLVPSRPESSSARPAPDAPDPPLSVIDPPVSDAKKKRRSAPRDPLLDHPAIIVYRDVAHLTPNSTQREEIARVVSEDKIKLWESTLKTWMLRGWKPGNVTGQLDVFLRGEFSNGNGHTSAIPDNVKVFK